LGCGGVLVLPPYFYKDCTAEGLFRYYAELIEEVADHRLRLYLYHIPQMTGVPITADLIDRLVSEFHDEIAGLKDSSGNMANTLVLIEAFPDLAFFPASETFLLQGLKQGVAGCISATANVQAGAIRALIDGADREDAQKLHERVAAVRAAVLKSPTIPALKALIAHYRNDPQWLMVRPPLLALDPSEQMRLVQDLRQDLNFTLEFSSGA
ncbi:MAG TPA: dihydrodipicolinate synthase family protein, partial [Hyphomicrobiaceae bacterium]|nr:dihydrodipicolinate synthase family protein [Hyphomicrobiaceae bacterium]